jgi:hypothetical protein
VINAPTKRVRGVFVEQGDELGTPSTAGIISGKTMLLLGLFPSSTLLLTRLRLACKHTKLNTDLVLCLVIREHLGLDEEVGEEDVVVGCVTRAGTEGAVRVGGGDKIGTLVRELVE